MTTQAMRHQDTLFNSLQETAGRLRAEEENVRNCVFACRKAGLSWEAVGAALGMSRQAAWERFRHDDDILRGPLRGN